MGYWVVNAVYRTSMNCSVPPQNFELHFATRPTITYYADGGCGSKRYNFSVGSTNWGVISNNSAWYHSIGTPYYVPDGTDIFDCVNGGCVSSTVYGTPGIYTSLEQCENNCGNNTGCQEGSECVTLLSTQNLIYYLG